MWMPLGLHVRVMWVVLVNAISSRNKTGNVSSFASDNFSMTLSHCSTKFVTVDWGNIFLTLISLRRTPCLRYTRRSFVSEIRLSGNYLWNRVTRSCIDRPAQRRSVSGWVRKSIWRSDNVRISDKDVLDKDFDFVRAYWQTWYTLLYVILRCRATKANLTKRLEVYVGDKVRYTKRRISCFLFSEKISLCRFMANIQNTNNDILIQFHWLIILFINKYTPNIHSISVRGFWGFG